MKKVIFECAGNSVLFILAGLMLIRPFSSYHHTPDGFSVVIGIMPFIFAAYLASFIAIRFLVFKGGKRPNEKNAALGSELSYADEREKIIVAESTKTAYQALVFCLIVSMAILAGAKAFSFMIPAAINIYSVGVMLIASNLAVAMISYCLKYCVEYRK